eukprot:1608961-Prymnesium_polylepis.1
MPSSGWCADAAAEAQPRPTAAVPCRLGGLTRGGATRGGRCVLICVPMWGGSVGWLCGRAQERARDARVAEQCSKMAGNPANAGERAAE